MATVDTTAPGRAAAADVGEPGAAGGRRPRRRVAGAGQVPARADRLQLGPHPPDRPRPAAAAARRLRRATARSSACGCCTSRVVFMLGPEANHFVTVGHPENFHWRESSFGDLIPLLGDGLLTDRRRLPRPRPGDHDARLPPRAGRRRDRGDGDRGRRRRSPPCPPARWSTSTTGCATWRCGSRCGRCSGSTPTRPARAPPRPSTSSAPSASTGSTSRLRLLRGPGSPWRKMVASRAGPRRDRLRRDRPPPRRPRPRAAATSSASCVGVRGERRRGIHRPRDPRPGDDPDVRRPRHLDLDPDLHAARAGPPPRGARPACTRSRTEVLGGATPTIDAAGAGDALPRHGPRRGPAPLPAGLDRPAPGGPRVRVRRLHGAHAAPTSTTAPGPATACPRSSPSPRPSSPSASPASARRRCRAAPTSPSAAARGSASASASARPR